MHIHILGICGTFMGGLAQLAADSGMRVTGCDQNVYPPMSDQLSAAGIELIQGYDPSQLDFKPDLWVIGNAMSRGNPLVEAILNAGLPYTSGPEFLANHMLQGKWVLAVSGTHGKTSTTSLLAWVLEYAGFEPGFLVGGVPANFGHSARLGKSDFFVIEADEYDSAFFDKRSKFVHYHPRTLIINNLEFDHADIFSSLSDIQRQFHQLVRIVPEHGQIIMPSGVEAIDQVIDRGCWTPIQTLTANAHTKADWQAIPLRSDCSEFKVLFDGDEFGVARWNEFGTHNMNNALAVIAAARSIGVEPKAAIEALSQFKGVKRRMETIYSAENIRVYDDFAHHPTAISTTLKGLRAKVGDDQIIAVIEPRSNTMKAGVHKQDLPASAEEADTALWFQPSGLDWSLRDLMGGSNKNVVETDIERLQHTLIERLQSARAENRATHMVIMSNGGFSGIHQKLVSQLETI